MNASLPQSLAPLSRHVAVKQQGGQLDLTLFPRRYLPAAAWLSLPGTGALTLLLMYVATNPYATLVVTPLVAVVALMVVFTPYRVRFRLSADGLLCDETPASSRSSFEVPFDAVETIRCAKVRDDDVVLVLEVGGRAHVVRCFGMRRSHAEALAGALQQQLEELRLARASSRT